MIRKLCRLLLLAGSIGLLTACLLLVLFLASQYEPRFYAQALDMPQTTLEEASDRALRQAAALASAMQKKDRWEAVFTAEQINGWLAVDLLRNHPKALPDFLASPRVAIDANRITLACRIQRMGVTSVLSLTVEPSIPKPNVIALRIVKARAGLLPMPLQRVLDGLSHAACAAQIHLEWQRTGGDPVALLSLPVEHDGDRNIQIEALDLREGRIHVVGTTQLKKELAEGE